MRSISIICILWLIVIASACGKSSSGSGLTKAMDANRRPYEIKDAWSWLPPIDGSGYCGPAALYYIISFYGDFGEYYYKTQTDVAETLEIDQIAHENPVFIDNTPFGLYIQPDKTGSSWSMLEKVGGLFISGAYNKRLYNVFVCPTYTKKEETEIRRARLEYIRVNLLEKGIPVVIHLTSTYPMYGHYVVLTGYDPEKGDVYYFDSLKNDKGIQDVSTESFLQTWFYVSGVYYSARWDGEWMALWHPDLGTMCDQCGG